MQQIDKRRAHDRVAADADTGRLSQPQTRQLPNCFIGERAAAADDTDLARLVNVAGHDADFALTRRDDARAIRTDQSAGAVFEETRGAGHIENRDTLRDGDNDRDAGVRGLHDGVRGRRRRHENHGGIRAGLAHGVGNRVEERKALLGRAPLARHDAADHLRAIVATLGGVKRPGLAEALAENAGRFIDEDAHYASIH